LDYAGRAAASPAGHWAKDTQEERGLERIPGGAQGKQKKNIEGGTKKKALLLTESHNGKKGAQRKKIPFGPNAL